MQYFSRTLWFGTFFMFHNQVRSNQRGFSQVKIYSVAQAWQNLYFDIWQIIYSSKFYSDIYLRVNFECTSISVHFKGALATNYEAFLLKL